jgi:acetyl esterase/lipase
MKLAQSVGWSAVYVVLGTAAGWAADEPRVVTLWPDGAPGALGMEAADVPTLTVALPESKAATGAAAVICPGGGYGGLALGHEGTQVAEWLNSLGVGAFILKYRLGPRYHHPAMLQDASRAIRTVRARAKEWDLDPARVGVIGFSAGGHLASTVGTHFDAGRPDDSDAVERVSSRPDFMVLVYPVVALATPYGHRGSLRNLLGNDPPKELVESLSNETRVTKETPPTFLAHTNGDLGVPAENSLLFVLALRKANVPVEFHLFEKGPHGLGLGGGSREHHIAAEPAFGAWPGLCATWLKGRGLLDRPMP